MNFYLEEMDESVAIAQLYGRVDIRNSHMLRATLVSAVRRGIHKIVVNLKEVTFMDSSGLSALAAGLHAMREMNGLMILTHGNEQVMMTLRLTKFDRFFPMCTDIDTALELEQAGPPILS